MNKKVIDVNSLKLVVMQKLVDSLKGYLDFGFFQLILLKMAEKSVSVSFQVLQASESWSKYTTAMIKYPIFSVASIKLGIVCHIAQMQEGKR